MNNNLNLITYLLEVIYHYNNINNIRFITISDGQNKILFEIEQDS